MSIKEKIEYILLQYPQTKFNRYEFYLQYLHEFHQAEYKDTNYIIPSIQLKAFFADWSTLDREIRKFLKEDKRFKIPAEIDLLRKRKEAEYRLNYSKK